MMKRKLFLSFLTLVVLLSSCTQNTMIKESSQPLTTTQQIDVLLDNPSLDPAHIGIYIEELSTGKIIYKKNEHKLLMPASNMKLVTTSSGLSMLGPDFRYETQLYTDGKIEKGVLTGNLIIHGSGDPVICGRFHEGNIDSIFTLWAEKLKELGIREIQGDLVGDNSLYGDDGIGYGWEKDDLNYYYGAVTSALSFNDNCVDLHFSPGEKVGDPVKIKQYPVADYLKIENQMRTVPADSASSSTFYRNFTDGKLYIRGTMPIDAGTDVDWATVPDPADFFMKALSKVLKENDISFQNEKVCREKIDYSDKELLFTHQSVPLKDIIHNINKISNNYYAETLLKTLCKDETVTTEKAVKTEKKFLASTGIDTDRMFIVDGSGLSRHNMVTVNQIATLLKYMHNSQHAEIFKETLPVAGGDGTLKNRLKGSNARGHVFAKTGYVGHVRALSGYVEAKNGKTYVFSIIANHYPTPTSTINNLQDQIVTLIYNHNQ